MLKKIGQHTVVILMSLFIRLLRLTYRIEVVDKGGIMADKKVKPMIVTMWHNRLLFAPAIFPSRIRKQFTTIASLSKDGQMAEMFMRNFGLDVVRGSSSKGGGRALIQLIRKLRKEEKPIAITIDGPRGPKYSCQPGAAYLAGSTGCPIVPYVANAKKYFAFRNWDNTQIPFPFTKVTLTSGEPIYLEKINNDEELELAKDKIIASMLAITED
jgi:lysophospholipid acyltransferase (LPLAT)-like uncharacterized protein